MSKIKSPARDDGLNPKHNSRMRRRHNKDTSRRNVIRQKSLGSWSKYLPHVGKKQRAKQALNVI